MSSEIRYTGSHLYVKSRNKQTHGYREQIGHCHEWLCGGFKMENGSSRAQPSTYNHGDVRCSMAAVLYSYIKSC